MGKFDLQATFCCGRALTKDFKDQSGTVDHFALELVLKIALLDRGKRPVNNDEFGIGHVASKADPLNLSFTEQRCRTHRADRQDERIHHFDTDRAGKALPFFKPRISVSAKAPSPLFDIGEDDDGARATGYFTGNFTGVVAKFKSAQESSPSQSPVRST